MDAEQRTFGTFRMMVLWFGASISIAEVMTGALLAPLGLRHGLAAILTGHAVGGAMLFLAGLIGARSALSATQTFRISFGRYGSYAFSLLNILQLLGWTAVMIVSGAKALDAIVAVLAGYRNEALWCVVIGVLTLIWITRGLEAIFRAHSLIIAALFLCMLVLGYRVFTQSGGAPLHAAPSLSFGQAVEFNVAMCLSWLPLISDYSRSLKHPLRGVLAGACCYACGGILMFSIGLGAALYAGASAISDMLLAAGLGVTGLFVIAFSCVAGTFLDAHSAGVSAANINPNISEKNAGVCVAAAGVLLALFVPMSRYEHFLYLIASVFAPLFAVLLVDVYLLGRRGMDYAVSVKNLLLWLAGFLLYRALIHYDSLMGVTLPIMLTTACLCFAANAAETGLKKATARLAAKPGKFR